MDHPIFEIERLFREHEMALSKTVSYHNSDVEKTMEHLRAFIHGVLDAMPGDVHASLPDGERAKLEARRGERDVSPQTVDAAKEELHKPGSALDVDVPVGATRKSDGKPQTQATLDKAQKAPPANVANMTFSEVQAQNKQ